MRLLVVCCVFMCSMVSSALAQKADKRGPEAPAQMHESDKNRKLKETADKTAGSEAHNVDKEEQEAIKKKSIRYSILFGVPINTYVVSLLTWDWGKTTRFRLSHEGWFAQNTYAGGADKAAHLFSFYTIMRILYNIYDYTEDGAPVKWAYSAGLSAFMALGIEIGDGFCKNQNGFSIGDLTMGFIGIGMASLLERFPQVDAFMSLSAEYYPTKYFRKYPQRLKWFLDDYSGWKFMVNIKLAGFRYVGVNIPDFMRYIMFDVGYYTRNFTKYDYRYGEIGRFIEGRYREKREVFIGVSVNMMEVVKDFFTDKESFACRALQQPFKYYHVPVGARYSFVVGE
jgi:hypothetical protein